MTNLQEQLESAEKDLLEASKAHFDDLYHLAGELHAFQGHSVSFDDDPEEASAWAYENRAGALCGAGESGRRVVELQKRVDFLKARAGDGKPRKYRLRGEVPLMCYPSVSAEDVVATSVFEALEKFAKDSVAYVEQESGSWMYEGTVEVIECFEEYAEVCEILADDTERIVFQSGNVVLE